MSFPDIHSCICPVCKKYKSVIYTEGKRPGDRKPICADCLRKKGRKVWE